MAVSQSLFSNNLFYSIPLPNYRFNHFTVFASSLNKPTTTRIKRKKVKSNDELYSDIREFLTSVGLPQYHVPSTNELSHHGRQDLANIVRRRGYKFIKELLQTSTSENVDAWQFNELEGIKESQGQEEKSESLADDIVVPNEAIQEGEIKELERDLKSIVATKALTSESTALTMEDKVARFIQHGELDTVEDSGFGALYDSYSAKTERNFESDDVHEPTLLFNYQPANDISLCSSNGTESLNGKGPSSSAVKVDSFLSSISTEECTSVNPDKDLYAEVCNKQKMENQDEIKRLKSILHQKEVELTQLKQQIEKEKLALSILQATAETEITKARNLVSEKETELNAAEESLSGLKEVEIQYSGEGESVEVAGSFNGWQQNIPMDRHSFTTEPMGSPRSSRLWKAVLWLYPGVYEIKFVVDGHWRIDPERELTTRGSFNNNILRVDR